MTRAIGPLFRVCLLLFLACRAQAAGTPTVVVFLEQDDERSQRIGGIVQSRLKEKADVRWFPYSTENMSNPIYRGRLIASLSHAQLVVAIGDNPTGLVLGELDETPVYFIGVSLISGTLMQSPRISGLMNYSADDVFANMPKAWSRGFGILYTPGYEPVVDSIKAAARLAGVTIHERRVAQRGALPQSAESLMEDSPAIWVLGDPLLVREASFEFLIERSLAERVPLVSPSASATRQGAVFHSQAKAEDLAARASKNILALLKTGTTDPRPRIDLPPSGGLLLYHQAAAQRFGLAPKPPTWVKLQ
ncbi:MAG: hypothetical protein HY078_06100 [Elusimicrobia bacterium]|nr:hypothetical protein [Elusimicrobiota bacterium]